MVKAFDYEGLRFYRVNQVPLPSVTTILNETREPRAVKALADWKARTSESEQRSACDRGTAVHKMVERYFNHEPQDPIALDQYGEFWESLKPVLPKIRPLYVEEFLWSDFGYAGRCDCWGMVDDKFTMIDFKTTNKPKKREWCVDHLCQLIAYSAALKERKGRSTEQRWWL